jgi:hypothetical protein
MSGDPGQDRVEVVKRFGFRRGRRAHDDDLDVKRARHLDLGVCRVSATVLRNQGFDSLPFHERKLISKRERTPRENQFAVGEGANVCRPGDRSYDVAMLRRSREGGKLQATLGQKYRLRPNAKSRDGVAHGHDLDPAVTRLARPGRPAEDDDRGTGRAAGPDRVGRHARSERMGRVDNGADVLSGEKRRQAFGAAKAADASRDWRWSGVGRRARQRQDCLDIGLIGDPPRERARLRRAAENEQAKALQWAAP